MKVSKMKIDEYVCGLLPNEEKDTVVKALAECEECKAYLQITQMSFDKARAAKGRGRERVLASSPSLFDRIFKSGFQLSYAVAAIVFVGVGFGLRQMQLQGPENVVYYKGAESERVFIKSVDDGSVRPLAGDAKVGELVKFKVPVKAKYLLVLALQENGVVSNFNPDQSTKSIQLGSSTMFDIPGSIRLDNYSGQESLYFLYSQDLLDFQELKSVIEDNWGALSAKDFGSLLEANGVTTWSVHKLR
jgi:hypothetical protein